MNEIPKQRITKQRITDTFAGMGYSFGALGTGTVSAEIFKAQQHLSHTFYDTFDRVYSDISDVVTSAHPISASELSGLQANMCNLGKVVLLPSEIERLQDEVDKVQAVRLLDASQRQEHSYEIRQELIEIKDDLREIECYSGGGGLYVPFGVGLIGTALFIYAAIKRFKRAFKPRRYEY